MVTDKAMQRGLDMGRQFIRSVIDRDADALAGLFAGKAVFRAVVPNEANPFREKRGGPAAAQQLMAWFGEADFIELLDSRVTQRADRVSITYRILLHDSDGWQEVEQQAYAIPALDGFLGMNLVCSGFRPVDPPVGHS